MRISTGMMYQLNVARMAEQQNALLKTQQSITTGRRIATPSDDPVGAAQALNVSATDGQNTQYATNRDSAKASLGLKEGTLGGVTSLIQDIQDTVIAAGNPTYTDTERRFLAGEVRSRLQQLIGLANTTDVSGQPMFSGFQRGQPFSVAGGQVEYQGDSGHREIQVAAGRRMAVSDSGRDVFETIRNGNGQFTTAAAAGNTGGGTISAGSVSDPTLATGHTYQLNFSVAAGVTTYSVVDVTSGTTLSSGNPYTSGNVIAFAGIRFEVEGAPASGDSFNVAPSANQSLFSTLENLAHVLETTAVGVPGQAALGNGLTAAHSALDNALEHVLKVRAATGANLKELDVLDTVGDDLHLQFQQTLSSLQDTDYNEAISRLARQQLGLEAAQQSFARVMKLSLFDYL
ncbi:MAG: flagellar hook-associated protein FlgL [Thiobacillus sp.]